uniref:Uncharacterized protein n=1 Tax=Timema bartmani TaxID=61472 RepID=A0A7R9EYR6_9NEOP|nr:unnamed protein product [Timema bartmani]
MLIKYNKTKQTASKATDKVKDTVTLAPSHVTIELPSGEVERVAQRDDQDCIGHRHIKGYEQNMAANKSLCSGSNQPEAPLVPVNGFFSGLTVFNMLREELTCSTRGCRAFDFRVVLLVETKMKVTVTTVVRQVVTNAYMQSLLTTPATQAKKRKSVGELDRSSKTPTWLQATPERLLVVVTAVY